MSKFLENDYRQLENKIFKKAYRLNDVKDKLEKVAFDIVKFKDDDKGANLWQVQSADDGDYIVALYEENEPKVAKSNWNVEINKQASEVNIFYKNEQLFRVKSASIGIPPSELEQMKSYLPNSLAQNRNLLSSLLKSLPTPKRTYVLSKYPELEAK